MIKLFMWKDFNMKQKVDIAHGNLSVSRNQLVSK